ncbi:hypothetical protein BLSTO_06287, partial [Blastocystis sp. subtype 1]
LAKSIYKTALRRAIAFDKEPVLKCLITQESFDRYYNQIKNGSTKERDYCKDRLDAFLCHNQFYSMDRSLSAFLRQQVQQAVHEETTAFAFSALLRLSDYLHSCLLYASNSGFTKSKMESTLPAPRDVRECYDRIHPSLETETRDQYAGYVLIQNPSALLQLKSWDEDDDRVKALLSSSVMNLPTPVQNQFHILFLS